MSAAETNSLLHPDFRVWMRFSPREPWREQSVRAMMVDMRRPRRVGHCAIPTERKVFLKIEAVHKKGAAEFRTSQSCRKAKAVGSEFYHSLAPGETATLQFDRDPGRCLHLQAVAARLGRAPAPAQNLVRFGPGVHTVPGGVLRLKSDQTLQLDEGAVLQARIECDGVKNVVIRGLGIVDLLATCPTRPNDEGAKKTAGLRITNSRDIRVQGITIRNPSHYGILLGNATRVELEDLAIFTHCIWGDGIDSMACTDLVVRRCLVRTSDDCLAVYADRGEFRGTASRHQYRGCTLWADVAHPVMIGVHGKQHPPGRVLKDLHFEKLTILRHCEPGAMYQGCLAIDAADLNTVRDVLFADIRIEDPLAPRLFDLRVLLNPAYNPVPGKGIDRIVYRNIRYEGNPAIPSVMEGYDTRRRVRGIRIKNLRINGRRQKRLAHLQTNAWAEPPVVK